MRHIFKTFEATLFETKADSGMLLKCILDITTGSQPLDNETLKNSQDRTLYNDEDILSTGSKSSQSLGRAKFIFLVYSQQVAKVLKVSAEPNLYF
nr:hypothetical protein BgiMline_031133 [Biomphalaria glabrata]